MQKHCGCISKLEKIEASLENSIGKLTEFPVLIGVILIGSLIVTIILGFIHRYGG